MLTGHALPLLTPGGQNSRYSCSWMCHRVRVSWGWAREMTEGSHRKKLFAEGRHVTANEITKVCLAGPLLLALCLCQLETTQAFPQLSPEVKKISILDLFQEEPSLKAELEARLIEKGKKPVVAGGSAPQAEDPSTTSTTTTTTSTTTTTTTTAAPESTTTTASEDKQSARAFRTRGRVNRANGPAVAASAEPVAEEGSTTTTEAEAGEAGGPARKLRPQRLLLRRERPGKAATAAATTEDSTAGDLPEPELEEGLVKTLAGTEGGETEGAAEAKEEVEAEPAEPAKKPRARFSLPPRRGAGTGGNASANKKVDETATEKASSGLDRLRNARPGGGRFRNSGGRQAPAAAAEESEASPAAEDDAQAKPLARLSLAERRSRFSNARTPPSAAAAEEEETPAVAEEAAAEEEDPAAGTPRRNARRFPTLARRNS